MNKTEFENWAGQTWTFYSPPNLGTFAIDCGGCIMTKEEMTLVISGLFEFWASHPDQEILAANTRWLDYKMAGSPKCNSPLVQLVTGKIRTETEAEAEALPTMPDSPSPGFVYFLRADNGAVKIGRTSNPNNRLAQISPKLPYKVKLLFVIETDDMQRLEADLHNRFACKHLRGEWFDLNPEDLATIKAEWNDKIQGL